MLVAMHKLSTGLGAWVNGARRLAFPPVCLFCQQAPVDDNGCCRPCLEKIRIWPLAACRHCGRELPPDMSPGPCGQCLRKPPAQQRTHSLYEYSGPVREAILAWKLDGRDAAARWLVKVAKARLTVYISAQDILLPVPMPLSRMRKSGQHHAANMCRWLAHEIGCRWDWRILVRVGDQARQSSLSGAARRKNLSKAFALADDCSKYARGEACIWIVDDILTTGATLHFAARTALKLGRPVRALSLARTSQKR
jgi:ComF family protein